MTRGALVAVVVLVFMLLRCAAESQTLGDVAASVEDPHAGPPPPPPPVSPQPPEAGTLPTAVVAIPGAERPADPLDDVRDGRSSRTTPRALSLLLLKIQQLETLERASESRSRDRPMIQRRLAEDYVELESAARRDMLEAEHRRDAARDGVPGEAGRQQTIVSARSATMVRARQAAIRWYTKLVDEYSGVPSTTFPQSPPPAYAMMDEVRYLLGWEYEQAGDLANARRLFFDVISKGPHSRYVALAYFAFGEMFLHESDADPSKLDI